MAMTWIHGRAQGGCSEDEIRDQWYEGLEKGFGAIGKSPPAKSTIEVPFYGDKLDEDTAAAKDNAWEIIFRGNEPEREPDALSELEREFLGELAERAGIAPADIEAEMDATQVRERAPWNWGWVQAIGRCLDRTKVIPNVVIWKVTKDVRTYLLSRSARKVVHDIIEPAITTQPRVIVAHSLGSIVAYWYLREKAGDINKPLLITAGSPLGAESVKRRLPGTGMLDNVTAWVNAADPRDPVAICEKLGNSGYSGVEDIVDINNPKEDAHSIAGYLSDPRVAQRIADALGI